MLRTILEVTNNNELVVNISRIGRKYMDCNGICTFSRSLCRIRDNPATNRTQVELLW